ncbi:MAG: ABC transporter ATP-binding protein [Proteobacteria bacterium]|nr:ABC transporter ATP-binding protein [Pseudomonadota bacterium]
MSLHSGRRAQAARNGAGAAAESSADNHPQVLVKNLRVVAGSPGTPSVLVNDVSFAIARGEVLALIGESGSGKTTVALSLMGHTRAGCRISGGSIEVCGTDVLSLRPREILEHRRRRVAYIAQSAAAAFNPARRIMDQVIETTMIRRLMTGSAAREKAVTLFRSLALPDPQHIGARYPHQLSGGQLQRLLAAMALMSDPELVILDEPTTALDVTTQIEVLRAFKRVIGERRATALYVAHDLAVVAQIADRVVVLNSGQVRESGPTMQVLGAPRDAYTRTLLSAVARRVAQSVAQEPVVATSGASSRPPGEDNRRQLLLAVEGLTAGYGKANDQGLPSSLALLDISLAVRRGAALGVIGESGSGKSTLARVLAGIMAPARGTIRLQGELLEPRMERRSREQLRRIQIVFQHADAALNPAHTVAHILGRPLKLYFGLRGAARDERIAHLLDVVHLDRSIAARRPPELSGGQKQRVNLARALAAQPDLILCDEVTSALDAVVGAAILDLLAELRRELGLSYVLITHDVGAVRAICDEVAVLYAGQTVETGPLQRLDAANCHPYTRLLVSSVPELRSDWLEGVASASPGPAMPATASSKDLCRFLPRCPVRIEGRCDQQPPPLNRTQQGAQILCHQPANRR